MSNIRENKLGKIIYDVMVSCLNFSPILLHNFRCRRQLLLPLYKKLSGGQPSLKQHDDKLVIYMVIKETSFSGGLSDRLRAITSIYSECKRRSLPFRINFTTPQLIDYLQPNEYDWRIAPEEICYNAKEAYPCTLLTYHRINNPLQRMAQNAILRMYLRKKKRQIHVYSNMVTSDAEYGRLFHELFKPTPLLQERIDYHLEKIGGAGTYISMVFRFRQLLGDFKEGGDTLYGDEREHYITRCVNRVEQMHEENPASKILVTSDSTTFLSRLSSLPYVYIIPGNVVHIGFTFDADKMTYLKSFVDYYMLSYASKVYLVRDKLMYHSGFALRAALLNGATYDEINLRK